EVGDRVAARFAQPPPANSTLAADQTGVGKPVVDMLRRAKVRACLRPVTVSAGHKATYDEGRWLVPKVELVSTLQVLLQSRRLKVAPALREAQTLVQELTRFQMKVALPTADAYLAWREGPHDDLVLAGGVAAWLGERALRLRLFVPYVIEGPPPWPWGR